MVDLGAVIVKKGMFRAGIGVDVMRCAVLFQLVIESVHQALRDAAVQLPIDAQGRRAQFGHITGLERAAVEAHHRSERLAVGGGRRER